LAFYGGGTEGVLWLVDRAEAFSSSFHIFGLLYDVKLLAQDGCDYAAKCGSVASQSWLHVYDGLLVFSGISKNANSGYLVFLIKAVVFNGLDKWRDKGRNRVGSFNVFPEVPIKEFVISLSSPLAVIVVGAVINNF
jgi:hypothetical protein